MYSDKMTLCLNLARTRGIFALARIGCRRQPSRREDLCGQASNRARRWNLKLGAKAEGLRGLHTSASLFGTNVLLKLHYSQCIPSLDAKVLHKLLTNITIVCIFSSIVPRPPPSKMSSLTVKLRYARLLAQFFTAKICIGSGLGTRLSRILLKCKFTLKCFTVDYCTRFANDHA